jgi:MFS family permease
MTRHAPKDGPTVSATVETTRTVTNRPWLVLAAAAVGAAMVGLDGTAITIAAPFIARTTAASLTDLQWIANAYLVTLAIGLLPAGRIADRFGRRATFMVGVLAFGISSVAIAFSASVTALIIFRAIQGLAGALLQPAAMAMMRNAFSKEKLPVALGVWGGVNALAIGLGPVFAGVIVQSFGWPAVFLVNLPIGVLAAVLGRVAVGESYGPGSKVFAAIRELLGDGRIAASTAMVALSSFGIFALLFMLTLYLQNVHGLSPIDAGLWMLLPTAIVLVSAPAGGVLGDKIGSAWPIGVGLAIVAVGLYGVAGVAPDSGYLRIVLPAAAVGIGTGLCVVAATNLLMATARESLAGMASAVQQAASQFGGVLGILVLGTLLSGTVSSVLGSRLTAAGVDATTAAAVRAGTDEVAQGRVPVPGEAVRTAAHLAFTDGVHTALVVAAIITAVGAVAGFLTGTRRPQK